MPSLLVN